MPWARPLGCARSSIYASLPKGHPEGTVYLWSGHEPTGIEQRGAATAARSIGPQSYPIVLLVAQNFLETQELSHLFEIRPDWHVIRDGTNRSQGLCIVDRYWSIVVCPPIMGVEPDSVGKEVPRRMRKRRHIDQCTRDLTSCAVDGDE